MVKSVGSVAESQKSVELEKRKLKESCQEFESFLTGFLIKSMRDSVIKAEQPDQAEEIYQSMMDTAVAKEFSRTGQVGLAETLYKQLETLVKAKPHDAVNGAAPKPAEGAAQEAAAAQKDSRKTVD
ncbi:MAG: rod-binding protein [Acidobacteriota bacterium]